MGNDLTWIGVVLRAAKSVKGLPVRPEIVEEARTACRELRLSERADAAIAAPPAMNSPNSMSISDGAVTAPTSRCATSCGSPFIRLAANPRSVASNAPTMTQPVAPVWSEMPNIRQSKEGNHRRFKYTQEAWEVIERQPKTRPCLPFQPQECWCRVHARLPNPGQSWICDFTTCAMRPPAASSNVATRYTRSHSSHFTSRGTN